MFHLLVLLSLIASNAYGVSAVLLTTSLLVELGFNWTSTYIQISGLNITEIDWNAFRGYSKMTDISMRDNQLAKIDIGLFRYGANLKTLDVIGNPLILFSNSRKYSYPALSSIYFSKCPLTSLDYDSNFLNGMQNLTSLDAGDQLKPLKPHQLAKLKKLEVLTITTRNQTNLTKEHFNGTDSLITLKFSSSNIKKLEVDTFIALSNLAQVDLSNNELTSLEFLQFPSKVNTVILQGNKLSDFKLSPTIGVVKYLDIANNKFTSFDSIDFSLLGNLEYLDLSNNPLSNPSEIASHLKYLVSIRTIKLSNLSISSIDSNYFENNPKINSITLNHNQISVLPFDVFTNSNAKYLQLIDLSNNQISFLDNRTFVGIELYYLNLNNNQLSKLEPGTFYIGFNVYFNIFSFSNNLISEVDRFAFSGGSPGLQEIYLDGNNLTRVDDLTFAGCTKLRRIILNNNPYLFKGNLPNLCPKPLTPSCSVLY